MGADKNYVVVETTTGENHDAVRTDLQAAEELDEPEQIHDEYLVVSGLGGIAPVRNRLHELDDRIERALLVHVYDTAMTTTGWYYEREPSGLVETDEFSIEGSYGAPVFDYFTREYDIPAAF
ncbi:hypothetical protein OB920_00060 [Halobacteria archaeon HArc-gm2]|nr:hypothetical protein [Halobacteria archaeon HArc-gm2]